MRSLQFKRIFIGLSILTLCLVGFQNCANNFPAQSVPHQNNNNDSPPDKGADSDVNANPSVPQLRENSAALALSEGQLVGAPEKGSILQRGSNNKVSLVIAPQLPSQEATYFRYKVLAQSGESISSTVAYKYGVPVSVVLSATTTTIKIQLQFFDTSGREIARGTTATFSVGDVFIVAGQSNAANHGEVETQSTNPLNRSFSPASGNWGMLGDPLPFASNWKMPQFGSKSFFGGSPWPTFADGLSYKTGFPVGMASVAWGGSSLSQWLYGGNDGYTSYTNEGPLVNYLIKTAQRLPNCGFAAVLWHQGESDSILGTSQAVYKAQMIELRRKFVQATGCDRPWFVAQASYVPYSIYSVSTAQMGQISSAQQSLWNEPGFAQGPNTDLLTSNQYRYDELHFSLSGLKEHGRQWVEKVMLGLGLKGSP